LLLMALMSIGLTLWVTWQLEGGAAAVISVPVRLHERMVGEINLFFRHEATRAEADRAMQGQSTICPEMTGKLVTACQALQGPDGTEAPVPAASKDPVQLLSPRERQILVEISRGASNKEIARTLDIAEATVKIRVQHILRKLNLSSRVPAAVFATARPG
jgi:DNA-binding NarL/FixJ family response regulator